MDEQTSAQMFVWGLLLADGCPWRETANGRSEPVRQIASIICDLGNLLWRYILDCFSRSAIKQICSNMMTDALMEVILLLWSFVGIGQTKSPADMGSEDIEALRKKANG